MNVRAKFTCNAKIPAYGSTTVYLNAVYSNQDGSRAEENKAFSDATPSGHIAISIADGKPALDIGEVNGRAAMDGDYLARDESADRDDEKNLHVDQPPRL